MEKTTIAYYPGSTINTVLTCPAGHKYEVVGGSIQNTYGNSGPYGFLLYEAGPAGLDWVKVTYPSATGFLCEWDVGPIVLYAGDSLVAYGSAAAGLGNTIAVVVVYIDVDYSD